MTKTNSKYKDDVKRLTAPQNPESKSKMISVRLSDSELKKLHTCAKKEGATVGKLIRFALREIGYL